VDYYANVVIDYLRADRALFINTECCIQLKEGNPDQSGPHWYCDAVTVDFRDRIIYLCEITYSASLGSLVGRLRQWHENWSDICAALARDCCLPKDWPVRVWLFVPEYLIPKLCIRLDQIKGNGPSIVFAPKVTPLEMAQPWKYRGWDRNGEAEKPNVPETLRL